MKLLRRINNAKTWKLYKNIEINDNELNILYLNVGQADSTLITMGEDVMLIDVGDKSDGDYIVEFLKAQGIEEIDYLIETHSGGMEKIVQNLDVCNVYMPQSAIKESEDNDTSIVIQLNYKDNKFLFMGDATSKVEKQLLNKEVLEKIDVLKVGHHGSNTSSSEKFLNVILPTYSIISVNNSEYSKHPSENTIERLNAINSKIYRTDVNGTIWITSNGTSIEIEELDINLNGNNKQAIILLEDRKYSLIFYSKILPFSSTTV